MCAGLSGPVSVSEHLAARAPSGCAGCRGVDVSVFCCCHGCHCQGATVSVRSTATGLQGGGVPPGPPCIQLQHQLPSLLTAFLTRPS